MNSLIAGSITLACICMGTFVGMFLNKALPNDHLQKNTEDTIKLASGMIATLAALVLGLLVASAKSSFDTINSQVTQMGAKIVLLDSLLAHYGPEAKPTRDDLRDALAAGIDRIWPETKSVGAGSAALEQGNGFAKVQDDLASLHPASDNQRATVSQAIQVSNELMQSKWLVIEQTQGTLPTLLFVMLVLWLSVLFVGIGLFAPRNATAITALFLVALSFSGAVFLMVEMSRPLDGWMKVSKAPLMKVLGHLDR